MKLIDTGVMFRGRQVYIQASKVDAVNVRNRRFMQSITNDLLAFSSLGFEPSRDPLNPSDDVEYLEVAEHSDSISQPAGRAPSLYKEREGLTKDTRSLLDVIVTAISEPKALSDLRRAAIRLDQKEQEDSHADGIDS